MIGLEGQVVNAAKVVGTQDERAGRTEAAIQGAVRVVAGQCRVLRGRCRLGPTSDHDLAVPRLDMDGSCRVVGGPEVGGHDPGGSAAGAEGGIVAGHDPGIVIEVDSAAWVELVANLVEAGDDDLAVVLKGNGT